jgi:hypothetical protein
MDVVYDLTKLILKFFAGIFLVFIISYSFMTKEWPPNPTHFKQTLSSVSQHPKENFALLQNYLVQRETPSAAVQPAIAPPLEKGAVMSDEAEIERMAALYEKRAAIFQGKTHRQPASAEIADVAGAAGGPAVSEQNKILMHEIEILKARVLTLEDQLSELQKNPHGRK